ncbi:MAG: chemotaxis response regulator protein-glutamate methylesterase [Chloroflexota bacterium]|nr:chemotaxis response regulator protein-glutamate methylesterase [Chloroflexota bacterium]
MDNSKIRVLVVDDSAFARANICKQLSEDPRIEIVDVAHNGVEALKKIPMLQPQVITLDVDMPQMDGLTALKHIMEEFPTPVVMLSSFTSEGATETIQALELGAIDFFVKHSATQPAGTGKIAESLRNKIRMASEISTAKLRRMRRASSPQPHFKRKKIQKPHAPRTRKIILIGSSTGGPQALYDILPSIPTDIPAPLLIVQHMPAGFTRSLAERLDAVCEIPVKEASEGDILTPGTAYIAPGDYHMTTDKHGRIALNQKDPECGVRPSVNVTMESMASVFGPFCICTVLTGMGNDGTRGSSLIKEAGGKVFVEHESTCIVFGMPKSIIDAGNADKVLRRSQIAQAISQECN